MKHLSFSLALFFLGLNLFGQKLIPYMGGTENARLWGYKDEAGNVVVAPKYDDYAYHWDGFALVSVKGKKGYINRKGQEITPLKYDDASIYFKEGLFHVSIGGKHGFVDTTGREVIPPKFMGTGDFDSGRAIAYLNNETAVYIDRSGQTIITLSTYQETHQQFAEGLCGIRKGGKWGFMDVNGTVAIPCQYDYVEAFKGGFAVVVSGAEVYEEEMMFLGGQWAFVDKAGRRLGANQYDYLRAFEKGVAIINKGGIYDGANDAVGGKWGFMDNTGREITLKYDYIMAFNEGIAHEGLTPVNLGGTWQQDEYGLDALVGGKWGFADTKGREVIPVQFDSVEGFINGEAMVVKNGEELYINTQGEYITPAYDEYEDY